MWSSLPHEIRFRIYQQCRRIDLKTLSQCSSWTHNDVSPVLWKRVEIKWESLQENFKLTSQSSWYRQLKFATHLGVLGEVEEESKGYISFGFAMFIKNFDPNRVTSLTIESFIVADGIRLLSEMLPNIRSLELWHIEDADWDFLPRFRFVDKLVVAHGNISDRWLAVCGMKTLKDLTFTFCRDENDERELEDEGLVKFENLTRLDMTFSGVNCLPGIASCCMKLEYLNLNYAYLADDGMRYISRLKALTHLIIPVNFITDKGLSYITGLSLQHLDIKECRKVTPAGLRYISKIKTLQYLDISDIDGLDYATEDDDFNCFGNLTSMRTLIMYFRNLTDASVEVILKMRFLEKLKMYGCAGFTEEAVERLNQLPNLSELNHINHWPYAPLKS